MRATLLREPIDADTTAARAALLLRGAERPFALIGAWAGGGAILGSDPVRVAGPGDDLLALLDEVPDVEPSAGAVGGGWVGYLGFEARHRVEPGHPPPPRPVPLPDGALAYYDHVLHLDAAGAVVVRGARDARARGGHRAPPRGAGGAARRPVAPAAVRHERVGAGPRRPPATPRPSRRAAPGSRPGDLFQANLCLRLEGRLAGDALDLFATAVPALPTDRAAFVAGPWGTVASLSPELFLTRRGRVVRSEPIKGTRPGARARRAGGVGEGPRRERDDRRPRAQRPRARLPSGHGAGHGARGGPPARRRVAHGVRGRGGAAPGRRRRRAAARDVPARLGHRRAQARRARRDRRARVDRPRGLHGRDRLRQPARRPGAERRDPHLRGPRRADLARRGRRDRRRLGGGGRGARGGGQGGAAPRRDRRRRRRRRRASRRGRAAPRRRAPRPVPRPDPAAGLYETILVADGAPQDLDAHLARLAASLARALRPRARRRTSPPASAPPRAGHDRRAAPDRRAPRRGRGARRHAARPAIAPVVLRPVVRPRRPRPAQVARPHAARVARGATTLPPLPLLLDADGFVLEASRATIVVRDAPRRAAHAAGRRPHPARRDRGARAARGRGALTLADLDAAAEVYVASALRGLSPAARTPAA